MSKVFERLFLTRIHPTLQENFGRSTPPLKKSTASSTSYTTHRKKTITARLSFQTLPKLLIKYGTTASSINATFPTNIYDILQSYLHNRYFLIRYRDAYKALHPVSSGVPQGSVLGPLLYLLYTADLPATPDTTTATFADETAVLASHATPEIQIPNCTLSRTKLAQKWRMKANETKSTHVTFTLKRSSCPPVQLNGVSLVQPDKVKYLGLHLDRRLTWRKYITTKRRHLDLQLRKLYWILGRKSQLSLENKLLVLCIRRS
jgi:hypothetical protein